jgi:diamine N-acetyltransferase
MHIRQASTQDNKIIAQLSATTFKETYWGTDTDENILQYIDAYLNQDQIYQELQDSATNLYYLAEYEQEAIGYIKIRNDIALKPDYLQSREALEIARLYVLKAYQSQKIGYQLLLHAEQYAEQEGCEMIWLCVWKDNQKALKFYEKYGFQLAGEYLFQLGTSTYIDWAMTKKID